jgi:hypothetical protein
MQIPLPHPNATLIQGLNKEQLTHRRRLAEMAVSHWEETVASDQDPDFVKELDFFKTELDLINKELAKKS